MLLFYCATKAELPRIRRKGLAPVGKAGVLLQTAWPAAQAACGDRLLVIDPAAVPGALRAVAAGEDGRPVRMAHVPPEAFGNLDPYVKPRAIAAAGGYVVRPGDGAPDVLLIFRRGVWDVPKGKLDGAETVSACALREVREEIGVRKLHLVQAVGATLHGYPRRGDYLVKTTHWFLMETPETRFTPEAREGIEAVAWTPWPEAARRVGYASLRLHMQRLEATVRQVLRRSRP